MKRLNACCVKRLLRSAKVVRSPGTSELGANYQMAMTNPLMY
ncbi:MAG: hypothetical protein R3C05_22120 [Pirellulaceae bacterium]